MFAKPTSPRPRSLRRGVTLVEMLVTVALLVLMMSVLVQVFTAATGAVSNARAFQELDNSLRQIDATIRTDLQGVTAKFTPPLNPKDNLGYFEYGENTFADNQGEDTDDYLRFTVRAPEGQLFTGRFYAPPLIPIANMNQAQLREYLNSQPMTITSQFAEVIYFLRNGNLYRRVLLVRPDLQSAVSGQVFTGSGNTFLTGTFGTAVNVSWQGVNDLSARPINANLSSVVLSNNIVLNTLGDLTNRENRFAYQRFSNDFLPGNLFPPGDGVPDDTNADAVHDVWPSLYYNMWNAARGSQPSLLNVPGNAPWVTAPLSNLLNADNMAFPYVFPGAYSTPHAASSAVGWIHAPDPGNNQNTIALLNEINHNPIDIGDSLPAPTARETWWGFPTWRETLHQAWVDPRIYVGTASGQPNGLHVRSNNQPAVFPSDLLPPMTAATFGNLNTPLRLVEQPNNDQAGSLLFASYPALNPNIDALWRQTWEDDLILSGVRSFDVKAYDDAFAGYVDLGWGDDGRLWAPYLNAQEVQNWTPPYIGALNANATVYSVFTNTWGITSGLLSWPPKTGKLFDHYQTMAHEGRIPPLLFDARPDYQFPTLTANLGDDNNTVTRLRRVWDTWSTDYSYAPATGVNQATGQPVGPPFSRPLYPSYPPPYQAPLRGVQIQIRVVDPRNERVKVLTIRQDFSDKL